MTSPSYYAPTGGLPAQTDRLLAGFARDTAGRVIIAHLRSGAAALREETGTTIVRDT